MITTSLTTASTRRFEIGATVSCKDGSCGLVVGLVLDASARAITHLMIEPDRRGGPRRLAPVDLVDLTADRLRLRCWLADFQALAPADDVPARPGEVTVWRGQPLYATDGLIGHASGLVADSQTDVVTHLLLDERHMWGHKQVLLPIGLVTGIGEAVRLIIDRNAVANLPAFRSDSKELLVTAPQWATDRGDR